MTIDSIVNRLANAQQRLLEAPLTRGVSETLRKIFIESQRAAISPRDRDAIFSRWTEGYKIEDLSQVLQILLPYCTAQTIAWHSGASKWQQDDKVVSVAKRHCSACKSPRAIFNEPPKIKLRLINSKKRCAQTEPIKEITNVPKKPSSGMKPINVYTQYSPNITVRRMVRIDPEVAKKTAEILNTDGFRKEEKRDLNYELVKNLTIGEAQGSSSFCNKIVEHTLQTPSAMSPSYLRAIEQVNRELSLELRYKRFGHAFSQKGMVALSSGKQACLEGASESFVFAMLRDTFEKFAIARKDLVFPEMRNSINASLSQALWHDNASDKKINEVHGLIHDRNYPHPVVVTSGYVWHSTQVIFFSSEKEDFFAYCNRGDDCGQTPGISIYRMKHKNKITPEFLKRITSRLSVKKEEYTSLQEMIEELGGTKYIYLPMKYQKIGNCVYISAKAANFVLFLIASSRKTSGMPLFFSVDAIRNARLIYKEFSKHDKELILEDILIDIERVPRHLLTSKETSYLQGLAMVSSLVRAWALDHQGRNRIDEDLLEKALRLT